MSQSRPASAFEAITNTVVGFLVALGSQLVVFPIVGIDGVTIETNLEIAVYFTIISLLRSYALRRFFNAF